MRLMEVVGNKIQSIVSPEKTIEELLSYTNATKTFRLEVIPDSQLKVSFEYLKILLDNNYVFQFLFYIVSFFICKSKA